MTQNTGWQEATSPFHKGERAAQEIVGVRERVEMIGRRGVRDFMPDQHRAFYESLPMIFAGHVDAAGWPWASVLYGGQGFIRSPDTRKLTIKARPFAGDPLAASLRVGSAMGFVGMGLNNRRRNRVNGRVSRVAEGEFDLMVDQSFGNCPQYIKTRDVSEVQQPTSARPHETLTALDAEARKLITGAETFFVATANLSETAETVAHGADMSHRGGNAGFVKVESDTLTIPDFSGNNFFNTLGNMIETPRAGLLFIDYTNGDLLMISGTTSIVWDAREVADFDDAERFWRLKVRKMHRLRAALPVSWTEQEAAPNLKNTGSWHDGSKP
ncbi:pyridoxamine 5'-phosphate oxidase family protein [Roseobacter sp. EG26]|uniref:pyridoxamine 5'-phosphate oxidase family protein n=1 Tax=Roseobacter sp. EG26 TaxID=3412477 RepID=UPI003CE4A093